MFKVNSSTDSALNLAECTNNQGESLNDKMLRRAGWLRGFRTDDIHGPRASTYQVASYVDGATAFIEDVNKLSTETIVTKTERETNYVHRGWTTCGITAVSPWSLSRMAARNQPNPQGTWYTRLTTARRLKVEVLLEDLTPVPEFEAAINHALGRATTFEKFQAIYQVLDRWGDIVPLEIEIGSSVAITDTEKAHIQFPEMNAQYYNSTAGLSTSKSADVTVVGGNLEWNDAEWTMMSEAAQDPQWHLIKVNKSASTISLLARELQTQLSELYIRRLSYVPPYGVGPLRYWHKTYGDNQHTLKTITSVMIRFSDFIELLTITYSDGTISNKHGGGGHVGTEHKFILAADEHITEMLIWTHEDFVYGCQFITSMGRCSPQYGSHDGMPIVARSGGGVLVGFLIHTKSHPQHGQMYSSVQGIWRHDLIPRAPKEEDVYSDYFGDRNGQAFNDRVLIGNSNTIRISSVEIRSGDCIDSIQFTYTDIVDGRELKSMTPRHGGSGGSTHQFVLENGENIVTISGRYGEQRITQLCFGTNRGRTSEVYGAGKGQPFSSLAPRDKDGICFRLQYICGKENDSSLAGVMFVWTPC